jgi:ribosomal protein S18 acetylase RimI-like enzyme
MTVDLRARHSLLSKPLATPLPLEVRPGGAVLECERSGRRYVVYCGHHENSSPHASARLLRKKLRDAREQDEASCEAAPLSGQSLSEQHTAWSSVTEGEDCGDGESVAGCARFGYQLVAYAGRSPVGYCTFVVRIEDAATGRLPSIEIEVLEIWVVPQHRGVGVGAALAESVAQLAVAGLLELESRLSRQRKATLFSLAVLADIHSSSGAHFLHLTVNFLREKIDELGVLFSSGLQHVLFDDIELELR